MYPDKAACSCFFFSIIKTTMPDIQKKSSGPFSKNMMTICFVRRDHFFDQYFQHWVISISLFFRIFVANVYKPQI